MEQQTAVEWLAEICGLQDLEGVIAKAKEMEKTQHNKTADDWWEKGTDWMVSITQPETQSFDKYYEERFKK